MFNPNMPAPPGGNVTPEQWQQYIATLTAAYQASSGFERLKLQSEIDNATKGRDNAIELQRMRDRSARYGVDQESKYRMAQLEQNAAQFERQHALDTRKADIEEAQLLSSLRSEPDQMFQAMDVEQALTSIRSGRPAQQLANVTGRTTGGTGVAAIDQATTYRPTTTTVAASTAPGTAAPATESAQPVGGTQADPRQKALRAVFDALPPSETEGLDPTGVAALNAAFELYKAPLRPGSLETLSPTHQAGLKSASRRIQNVTGKSYSDFLAEYEANKPRQGSVRAA